MKKAVLQSFRDKVEMKPAGSAGPELIDKLLAPPEFPGMSRPLWMVMAGSIPTLLGWYGYYKFSVEEELFQVWTPCKKMKHAGASTISPTRPFCILPPS